jgi:hypothetical protein
LAVFTYLTAFQRMYHVWKQTRPLPDSTAGQ